MVDIACLAPHPDDAELCCGGLLIKAKRAGLSVGIIDCTRGEMGTRGSPARRKKESAAADRLLGTDIRINLKLADGHLQDNEALRVPLVKALRKLRPRIVLAPYWEDQHPDHAAVGRAAEYVSWLCGAPKFAPSSSKGIASSTHLPYRPETILYYNNRYGIDADLVVDISDVFEEKVALAGCYESQFGPGMKQKKKGKAGAKKEPLTKLSSAQFLEWIRALHSHYGFKIGTKYGEGYCVKGPVPIRSLKAFL